jgi:IS1 family transposase
MRSLVKQKTKKQWVWIAMDQQTRQIIAFRLGDRSRDSAKQLWANIPPVYRKRAHLITRISMKPTKVSFRLLSTKPSQRKPGKQSH